MLVQVKHTFHFVVVACNTCSLRIRVHAIVDFYRRKNMNHTCTCTPLHTYVWVTCYKKSIYINIYTIYIYIYNNNNTHLPLCSLCIALVIVQVQICKLPQVVRCNSYLPQNRRCFPSLFFFFFFVFTNTFSLFVHDSHSNCVPLWQCCCVAAFSQYAFAIASIFDDFNKQMQT